VRSLGARRALIAAAGAALSLAASCPSNGPPPPARFFTVAPRTYLGIGVPFGDAEDVGTKRVSLAAAAFEPIEITSVRLTHWLAGHNDAATTREFDPNALTPNGNPPLEYFIPGSEDLDVCEALYFSWAVTYRVVDGVPGAYFGAAEQIMPTRTRLANGSIEQALCAEPPGPEV